MGISNKALLGSICLTLVFFLIHGESRAQRTAAAAIDELFSELDATTPGASVMVVEGKKVIYEKGYGAANLEYDVPVNGNTVFHVASLSKQFTVFAVLLLEKEGRLSLDDDIRKYLPDLPDFGETITLRHLTKHMSGLRDQWDLLKMSGVRLDDVITQNHVLKLVENQQALNFSPGERNLYCNTGFTLLAEVVEKISGQRFADFTRERIFAPLGMKNTQFYDDHEKVVPNRAYSYKRRNGQFVKSTLSYATVGPTSLFTTAEDFSAWAMNFTDPKVGDATIFTKMNAPAVLNSGEESEYYSAGQFIGDYRGLKNYYHSGSDAGYRSYFIRIPEYELSVAVFSNLATFNPGSISLKIVDIVLEDKLPAKEPPPNNAVVHDPSIFKAVPAEDLAAYTGNYWSDEYAYKIEVSVEQDTLVYQTGGWDKGQLLATGAQKFKMVGSSSDVDVVFAENENQERTMTMNVNQEREIELVAFTRVDPQNYVGSYFSEELQTFYELAVEDGELVVKHSRLEDVKLTPVRKRIFLSEAYYLKRLDFVMGETGEVIGFKANNGRVKNLWFARQGDK